ncbi:Sushi, von Willebrand factor type A, EGF and pentraxin domain-containing protein 1 [Trachymyrmex septentrionalis]|uniref:Sushi, von Willebrand factor type A, EGF and pentraxin domain-containing protein 1 n=1 Tax=Trachymyrmex septentrionalis TaxID=34720 RepID=A0A151JZN8_9HYME|nr:Sushi, von Willebrand factor type A, EGF and pentraxin domain-containing protein 1 [Trachymyrmex septentrionalis]
MLPVGTRATYSCERGFELLGPARRDCQAEGSWVPEGVPFCVLNVAGGKAPMQSSTMEGGFPQRAVDGSSGQRYTPQTCTLTKPERRPWWYVNLLEPYMVQLVRLDFGKPCCGNDILGTITVRVGNNQPDSATNPVCNQFTGSLEEGRPLFLPCNPPMPGAFVSVHLEVSKFANIPVQLSLCEAFVYTDQALPIERCPQFRDQPPGSTATYNGKCYIFYNRHPLIFKEALAFCRSRGGTLVDESNPALQGFISWELWRRHGSDMSIQYWMGAVRDQKDRTLWRWTGSGEEVSVSFWDPLPGEEDCVRYDGKKSWLWSDTPCSSRLNFICQHQPQACGRPEQPPNSTMMMISEPTKISGNVYEVGATVEYQCDSDSLLVGPLNRTCLDTGFYNEFPPVCKYIDCNYPANIKYGSYILINETTTYLSQVQYTCDDGYEMTGRARLICDVDERWNGPPPRCEPILCDPPATVAHSSIEIERESVLSNTSNQSLQVNSIVTYTCEKGYRLVGYRQIMCLSTGSYDRVAPTCTEEPRTTLSSPTRATLRPSTPKIRTFLTPRTRTTASTATTSTTLLPSRNVPNAAELPATVRETVSRRPSIGLNRPVTPSSVNDAGSDHPQDNEISGSGVDHAQAGISAGIPEPSGPFRVDSAEQPSGTHQAKLNLGAVIALGVFGGFVFLAAVITTVVILIRSPFVYCGGVSGSGSVRGRRRRGLGGVGALRGGGSGGLGRGDTGMPSRWYTLLALPFPDQHLGRRDLTARRGNDHPYSFTLNRGRSSKHYRHRASPDCNTVASFDSSSSESRGGLNRYYRQAWENLHETTGHKAGHPPLRRKETLDEPGYRENFRGNNTERDGSELVVSDVAAYPSSKHASVSDKKRHHHHHHHHHGSATPEWRQSQSHHRY